MKQIESLGEGVTHLIINGDNTDYIETQDLKEYLDYLYRFVFKLQEILKERGVKQFKY